MDWEKLDKETRDEINGLYYELKNGDLRKEYTNEELAGALSMMESLFGKDNVSKPPSINSWCDAEKRGYEVSKTFLNESAAIVYDEFKDLHIEKRIIASCKIAKLIEVAYGGHFTLEERHNDDLIKYGIAYDDRTGNFEVTVNLTSTSLLLFRTCDLAHNFIAHNTDLLRQYFILD